MSRSSRSRSPRRDFLAQLGGAAAMLAGSGATGALLGEMAEGSPRARESKWDVSWVDKLASAKYRVAFDAASRIDDNLGRDYAAGFFDQTHEVYDTSDADMRTVIVYRQLGTAIALNDSVWERYPLGEDNKLTDPQTKAPYKRNPFWKSRAGALPQDDPSLERLTARGAIVLVCNIAAGNVGSALARMTGRNADEVRADVRANLVPGAVLVPSGVWALIRAQNAGCAFFRA